MKVSYEFSLFSFNAWSGAIDTQRTIIENGKEKEFDQLCEELFEDGVDEVIINDFLWFEDEYIYEQLGITEED